MAQDRGGGCAGWRGADATGSGHAGGPAGLARAFGHYLGLAFALNNILFRRHQDLPVGTKIAAMTSGCVLMSLTLLLIAVEPWPEVDGMAWLWAVAYGLGWLLLATLGTQWGVTHLEAGPASFIIMMELLVAVVTATWLGGEVVTTLEAAGGTLIVGAAVFEAARAGAAPAGAN